MMNRAFFSLVLVVAMLILVSGCASKQKMVAVSDFENLTGTTENDYLERVLAEYLTSYLANSGAIMLLERQDIYLGMEEITGSVSDSARRSLLKTLGRKIDADYIVCGSLSQLDKNMVLNARLFDVKTGMLVPGSAVTVTCTQHYELYDRTQNVGAFLEGQLRVLGAVTPAGAVVAPATH